MIHIICVYMLVRWNNALFNRTHNRTFPRNFEARRVTSYGCVQGAAEARRLPTRITATRARYVFSLRERPILLLFSITLSLSLLLLLALTDVIQRGPPRFRERRRERGGSWRGRVDRVIAGAGWHRLMGFEDSGVTPRDLTARLPRIMNPPPPPRSAEDGSSPFSRWIWNRGVGRRGKKGHG